MNNRYLSILMISLLIGMACMGIVCAKESMKTHDFKDFKMDVPKDSNFVKQPLEDLDDDMGFEEKAYLDEKNQIVINYGYFPIATDDNVYLFYQFAFESLNPDLNQSIEYQEDNLRIIEPNSNSDMYFSLVGVNSGSEMVMLFGDDVNLLKTMAHSVEFQ